MKLIEAIVEFHTKSGEAYMLRVTLSDGSTVTGTVGLLAKEFVTMHSSTGVWFVNHAHVVCAEMLPL